MSLGHAEIKKCERVVGAESDRFLQLIDCLRIPVQSVIVQTLQIVSWNRIGLGLNHTSKLIYGFLIASMLAIGDCVGDQLICNDAMLWIGQIAAANRRIAAARKSRVPQCL